MKKTLLSLFIIVGIVGAATYYNGTGPSQQTLVGKRPFVAFLDATADTGEAVYSNIIDLYQFQLKDSVGINSTRIGSLNGLCYDVSDAAAVTDSVRGTVSVQFSKGAGDGANPNSYKSWVWASVTGDSAAFAAASDANASVTGSIANVVLSSAPNGDRYARIKYENTSTGGAYFAKNVARCKFWWQVKAVTE